MILAYDLQAAAAGGARLQRAARGVSERMA